MTHTIASYLRNTSVLLGLFVTSTQAKRDTVSLAILFLARHSYLPLSLRNGDQIINSDRFLRGHRIVTMMCDFSNVNIMENLRDTVPERHELILVAVATNRAAIFEPCDFRWRLTAHLTYDPHARPIASVRILHGQRINFRMLTCLWICVGIGIRRRKSVCERVS